MHCHVVILLCGVSVSLCDVMLQKLRIAADELHHGTVPWCGVTITCGVMLQNLAMEVQLMDSVMVRCHCVMLWCYGSMSLCHVAELDNRHS